MRRSGSESGMTLVEILVAMAISALILPLVAATLFQFMRTTQSGHDQLAVAHDQQAAFDWLNRDAQMSVSALATVSPSSVTMNWTDAVSGTTYQSRYAQSGSDLVRTLTVNGTPSAQTVAHNLPTSGFSAAKNGDVLSVTIASSRGQAQQALTEMVYMRPPMGMATPFPTLPPTATYTPTPTPTPTFTPTPTPTATFTPTATATATATGTATNTATATATNTATATATYTPTATSTQTPTATNTPTPTNTFTPTPTNTNTPTPTATPMRLATGSYTGNGVNLTQITGVGFQPDVVIIKGGSNAAVVRTSTMAGDASKVITNTGALLTNRIESLDKDGFTLGSDSGVNQSKQIYYWVAMMAGSDLKVGSYAGNGTDNRSIRGVGFQPVWVLTMADGNNSVFRPGPLAGDNSYVMTSTSKSSNGIQALEADGFQVGSAAAVNQSGLTYHYIAWGSSPQVTAASYTGSGVDNRSITGVGFQPLMTWIKCDNLQNPVWRPASLAGDSTLFWSTTAAAADRIQSFIADGFQIGTNAQVNTNKSIYYYLALRDRP